MKVSIPQRKFRKFYRDQLLGMLYSVSIPQRKFRKEHIHIISLRLTLCFHPSKEVSKGDEDGDRRYLCHQFPSLKGSFERTRGKTIRASSPKFPSLKGSFESLPDPSFFLDMGSFHPSKEVSKVRRYRRPGDHRGSFHPSKEVSKV